MHTIRFALIVALILLTVGPLRAGDTAEPAPSPDSAASANTTTPNDSRKSLVASQTATNLRTGQTGWIGIRVAPVSEAMGKQLALPDGTGLTVVNLIDEGPADKAGIQRYDVITAVNGKPAPAKPGTFVQQIVTQKPGRRLRFEVIRAGKHLKKTVVVSAPRTLGEVGYKYDANGKLVKDVEGVQAKVYRKVNNNWVPESDPNRIKRVLGRNNEAFTSLANAEIVTAEPPAETVGWTDNEGNRVLVNRNGKELTVVKAPLDSVNNASDGKTRAWNYDSPEEFSKADPNTHAQFARLARQQRVASIASRSRLSQLQIAQAAAPDEGRLGGETRKDRGRPSPVPSTPRGKKKQGSARVAKGMPDEIESALADAGPQGQPARVLGESQEDSDLADGANTVASGARPETKATKTDDSTGLAVDDDKEMVRKQRSLDETRGVRSVPKSHSKYSETDEPSKPLLSDTERRKLAAELRKMISDVEQTLKQLRMHRYPAEEFRVSQDGRITVIRRKGDSAIRLDFKDTRDLIDRAPATYKRYRQLRQAVEAK